MRRVLIACCAPVLALASCRTPPPAPSLLDREFEAYRLDRDERRAEDLSARRVKAKAETDRLEAELAALMRRIREANAALPDARAEAERLAAGRATAPTRPSETTFAPSPGGGPGGGPGGAAATPVAPGSLPAPIHRERVADVPAAPR